MLMETMIPEVLDSSTKTDVERLQEWTKSVVVRTPEERITVYDAIRDVKNVKDRVIAFFADSKKKAHDTWKAIVANEKSFTDRLDAFEFAAKKAIGRYNAEQEAIREAERKRLQAIADEQARKEREKREQEAARQRAIEEEQRRKAEEARHAAESAKREERERLLREAEAAERKAAAAQVKAESKEEAATTVVAPIVQVAPAIQKQKGESHYTTWKAKIIDIAKIPGNYYLQNPKVIDAIQSALNKFAVATKGAVEVAGVEFYSEESLIIKIK
jgi:hypothetical protein